MRAAANFLLLMLGALAGGFIFALLGGFVGVWLGRCDPKLGCTGGIGYLLFSTSLIKVPSAALIGLGVLAYANMRSMPTSKAWLIIGGSVGFVVALTLAVGGYST
ncbi:MAG TPA: hypothetical protein VEA35_12930 [Ramlibacter sp.]|nr:hypothetical protein [Ramlibacter sp.]